MKTWRRASASWVWRSVLVGPEAEHGHPHEQASHHAQEVGVGHEGGKHARGREHPGEHQELRGAQAHRAQGVHLLVDGHGPEHRREGRAGPARHHDAGHEGPELARHRDRHQARHVDGRSERLQLHRAHEREHRADEEVDEGHDPEGGHPRRLESREQVDAAEARLPAEECHECDQGLPREGEGVVQGAPGAKGHPPDPGGHGVVRDRGRFRPAGHRPGQRDQTLHPGR